MPLRVVCFSTYLTEIGSAWRSDDYNAHDFIHAIKDRELNGYAYIPVRGKKVRIDAHNRQDVVAWFAAMAGDYLKTMVTAPLSFVPVPGSKCAVTDSVTPRTTVLAEAVANELGDGFTVADVLRWRSPMPAASAQGGSRRPGELFANLALVGPITTSNAILVDDVFTSGGHLQAGAAVLRQQGVDVRFAICAGRADSVQPLDPFAVRVDDLADFTP